MWQKHSGPHKIGDAEGYGYITFDDDVLRAAAKADPVGFVGDLREKMILDEVQRVPELASRHEAPVSFHHFRDKDGVEVDIVLESSGRRLAGVEVKASATVTSADFRGLRKMKGAVAERLAAGVVLYDGESSVSFGEGLFAVPIRRLWEF